MYWLIWEAQVVRTWLPLQSGSWHRAWEIGSEIGCGDGQRGVSCLVGELPCEDCGRIFVSCYDLVYGVLEGVDDGWVGVEFCLGLSGP